MHRTRTTVLRAGRIVMIAIRRRMCGVAFLHDMHGIFEQFAHARDERPHKQRRESNGCDALHQQQI